MRKILTILLIVFSATAWGQAEPNNFRTPYDTLIRLTNADDGSQLSNFWLCKVYRPLNLYTTDTVSRLVIVFHEGAGEFQKGVPADSNIAKLYGPFFWMANGWDGSVPLGNGLHRPILIVPVPPVTSVPAAYVVGLYMSLKTAFHPRGGYFLTAGLSQGGYHVKSAILHSISGNQNPFAMKLFRCFADLQGVGPDIRAGIDFPNPGGFGTWAGFGGRYWASEGTADSRNLWQISQAMNAAVPNSAYFAYSNYGSPAGGHGSPGFDGISWNWNTDPNQKDWHSLTPPALPSGLVSVSSPANTMGNYYVDAVNGSSLFQWMLRQGDTTLIGGCNPLVSAGSNQTVQLPASSASTTGSISYQCGHTANSVSWSQVSGPNTAIISASSVTATFSGLIAGTYQFQLNVVDQQGGVGNAIITITVLPEVPPVVSAGGPYSVLLPLTSITLSGTATGQGGASITSTTWAKISGSGTQTILNNTTLTPTITGLQLGTYVFQLTATDNNGNTSTSNATIVVSSTPATVVGTKVGQGEYQVFFIDKQKHLWGVSTNTTNIGVTSGALPGLPNRVSVSPANLQFQDVYGSLHSGGAIDTAGFVWMWSEGDGYQIGDGNLYPNPVLTPIRLTVDNLGNPFTGITSLTAGFAGNAWSMWYAIKNDGTLWVWGLTFGGMAANGTAGDSVKRPTQIVLPAGRSAKKVIAGAYLMVLMTDGTVWTCGGNGGTGSGSANQADLGWAGTGTQYYTLHQLQAPAGEGGGALTGITDISGGIKWSFAYSSTRNELYGWGTNGNYLGLNVGTDKGQPVTAPLRLTNMETAMRTDLHPIRVMVTNSDGAHFILTDGTLWGNGDQAQGGVGNGVELNYANQAALTPSGSTLWAFNLGFHGALMQSLPVRIAPNKSNFMMVWGGSTFVYYTYAIDSNGVLYSWGRDKGAILGRGIIPPPSSHGDMEGSYPNSWDVLWPTPVDPLGLVSTFISTSPGCVLGILTGAPCNTYVIPANTNTKPVPNLQLTSSGNQLFTNAGASTDNVHISYYLLTQLTGAAVPLGIRAGIRDTLIVANGTYSFKIVTVDNGWLSDSTTNTIIVSQTGIPPIVSAGANKSITVPANSVTLVGTATAQGGATITGTTWSLVSGNTAPTIVSPSSLTTVVNNLLPGTYVFQLRAVDSNGNASVSTVQVLVNCSCFFIPNGKLSN